MARSHNARVGDLIVIHEHRLGEPRREGEILEVLGTAEREHYRVRWDDGREALFYPGGDAVIRHARDPENERVLIQDP